MKFRHTAILLGLVLALGGCVTHPPQPSGSPTPQPSSATPVPRPDIPADFVSRIDGSTATIPLSTAALQLLRGTAAGLHQNTTDNAYNNLISGDKDVIFVTAPSPDELAAAQQAGVELEVIPVVKDALVFLANADNPTSGLTQQQVKDIYTGQTTNWNQVGGPDATILPYQRPVNSGSQTLFLQLAMGTTTPMDATQEMRPNSMGELVDVVSMYDNSADALGYSFFYYTQQMYNKDNVKLLAIDGVTPSTQTISDGTYPYLTYYYAVVRKDEPADSTARQLINWMLAGEGQQVAASVGYVPLDPSNIVPLANQYGFAGSTQQNTTQSSGTGGPQGQVPTYPPDPCPQFDCVTSDSSNASDGTKTNATVSLPDYPEAQSAAQDWINSLPAPLTSSNPPDKDLNLRVMWTTQSNQGLFALTRYVTWPIGADVGVVAAKDGAVFRLSDGHRLTLSDLFYDNVNYIDFINQNLLNTQTNQALADMVRRTTTGADTAGTLMTPFTGLPSTYDQFSLTGGSLNVILPPDNPFLTRTDSQDPSLSDDLIVPINLPADLSPYGVVWRIETVSVGQAQVQHMIRNSTGPSPVDDIINQHIDDFVRQHPTITTANLRVSVESISLECWTATSATDGIGFNAEFDYNTGAQL